MTQTVDLAYGRTGLRVELARHDALIVEPADPAPLPDPASAIRDALRNPIESPPLASIVKPYDRVVISVCDGTRAQPREAVLAVLLAEMPVSADVTVLIATGTHRANTPDELRAMLGDAVLQRCNVVNHVARDPDSLVDLGVVGDGVPLALNRLWVEADVRITTGFVEPHFFAGFSGGPKMVTPGLAGIDTVMVLHDAKRIGHANATWGVIDDNPVHADIRACAAACPPHFSLDVLLTAAKHITHVYGGELFAMHRTACATAREIAMRRVPDLFDVVVTTNSGYPLDQNLYQAVKGMSAAERIVRPGGTVVLAAECVDGLPSHGSFASILHGATSAAELRALFDDPTLRIDDQWQVQVLARILARARVQVHCAGLSPDEIRKAHLEPIADVALAVSEALDAAGPNATLCYLPSGPQTIPYVA